MDAVTQTNTAPAVSNTKPLAQNGTMISSDFQTFLLMLTTQIQNQDPLNPMESTEFAQQLATFSGVEQQVKTNTLLESLSDQMGLSGMAQMAAWVGMDARVAAPALFDSSPLTLYPTPAQGADQAMLVAFDALGREVTRHVIPVSADPLLWAGTDGAGNPLAPGAYSFRFENYKEGELIATTEVQTYGRISEVRQGLSGVELVLDSGAVITASDIKALRSGSG